MKVLHILSELRPSGAEVMLGLAAPIWRDLGCELHILAIAKTPGPYAETLQQAGWKIHLYDSASGRFGMIWGLSAAIRAIGPDLIHLHSERRNFPNTIAVWRCGIPMVRTIHNNFLFSGWLRQQKKVERMICRMLGSQHVAISSSVQDNEQGRFANPAVLCWNWFDADRYRPPTATEKLEAKQRLGLPLDRRILVSVGNGSDIKNYAAIIGVLAQVNDPSLHYYQVGNAHPDGTDQALVAKYQLEGQVCFCGPRDDVLDWLWACDLFVMPSIFEGFGLAAAEAMASGCNCLFSECPGLSDFKSFGLEAFWAKPSAASFGEAIQRWQAQPLTELDLQHNAEIIQQQFHPKMRTLDYYALWQRTLITSGKIQK